MAMPSLAGRLCVCCAAVAAISPMQAAAVELYSDDKGSLDMKFESAVGQFFSQDDYSGQGRDEVNWTEAYGEIGLNGEYRVGGGATIYGAISGMATANDGDGDAGGFSSGDEEELGLEDGYVGVRTDSLFGSQAASLDFSAGSQEFVIGDGWLIQGDSLNLGNSFGDDFDRGGAYWLAARRAFGRTAIASVETDTPWRGDVFYLGSRNQAQGDADLAGVNVEYKDPSLGTLGAYYFRIFDVDDQVLAGIGPFRDGLNTLSVRGKGSLGIPNASFSAEATLQRGSPNVGGTERDVEAYAWYVQAGYQFADLPLAPRLTYRFSSFSGDDPDTTEQEAFDPLFYGFSRGYGTWFQGEVAGNFTGPFNSNANIHHAGLYLHPTERIQVGALFFDFSLRETTAGQSEDFAQELDIFVNWPVTKNLFISPVYAYFDPKQGVEDRFGTDETNHYFQLFATVNF